MKLPSLSRLQWVLAGFAGLWVGLMGSVAYVAVAMKVNPPDVALLLPAAPPPAPVAAPAAAAAAGETIQHVDSAVVGLPQSADPGWVATMAARTGIPPRAMSAYADAELGLRAGLPGCHLSWNMLAGIGLIESNHGQHAGAVLRPDGSTSIRILGPALDGQGGTRAIPATPEGVRLDGDPRWDHAVGPMQFLPSTWTRWGRTSHARAPDPNNVDDAALTAGAYLCAGGRNLSTATGWRAGIGSYNAPEAYNVLVTAAANRYALASLA